MLSQEEIKDLLPQLLGNAEALENSVIGSVLNLCDKKGLKFYALELSPADQLEPVGSFDGRDMVRGDESGDFIQREFISALLPGVDSILTIATESEADKENFFVFFEEILKKSFAAAGARVLIFDAKQKIFVVTADGATYQPIKITAFVNLPELLASLA